MCGGLFSEVIGGEVNHGFRVSGPFFGELLAARKDVRALGCWGVWVL